MSGLQLLPLAQLPGGGIAVSWRGGAADSVSGVAGYRVASWSDASYPAVKCVQGRNAPGVAAISAPPPAPPPRGRGRGPPGGVTVVPFPKPSFSEVNGSLVYKIRVCAFDAAGHVAPGVVIQGSFPAPAGGAAPVSPTPSPQAPPPAPKPGPVPGADDARASAAVAINGGAALATSLDVILTFNTVNGTETPTDMCIKNAPAAVPCKPADFKPFAPQTRWRLAEGGDGNRTVLVWLQDVYDNVAAEPANATIQVDITPPSNGKVTIAGNAKIITSPVNVPVNFSAWDFSGVAEVCWDTNITAKSCVGSWQPFMPSVQANLSATEGMHAVRAFFKDAHGHTTVAPATATVVYDASPPDMSGLQLLPLAHLPGGGVSVSWQGSARDVISGVAGYRVASWRNPLHPAVDCAEGPSGVRSVLAPPPAPPARGRGRRPSGGDVRQVPFPHASFLEVNGSLVYNVRVCAVDAAGHVSPGVAIQGSFPLPTPQPAAPGKAPAPAPKPPGPVPPSSQMPASGDLPPNAGLSINRGASPALSLDVELTVTALNTTDAPLGMCIKNAPATPCAPKEWKPYTPQLRWSLAPGGDGNRTVLVWLVGANGVAATQPANATVFADVAPPTGARAKIANGAPFVRSRKDLVLDFEASDASGVAEVCYDFNTTRECSGQWVPFQPSTLVTLRPSEGRHTVRAWFKDTHGHVTPAPALASVVYDVSPPDMRGVKLLPLTLNPAGGGVTVSWRGNAGDRLSGVASYRVASWSDTFYPAVKCVAGARSPGVVAASAPAGATSAALPGASFRQVKGALVYKVRVCAVDRAGNVAPGVVVEASFPAPEAPPAPSPAPANDTKVVGRT